MLRCHIPSLRVLSFHPDNTLFLNHQVGGRGYSRTIHVLFTYSTVRYIPHLQFCSQHRRQIYLPLEVHSCVCMVPSPAIARMGTWFDGKAGAVLGQRRCRLQLVQVQVLVLELLSSSTRRPGGCFHALYLGMVMLHFT
jgi:hypothetical protein